MPRLPLISLLAIVTITGTVRALEIPLKQRAETAGGGAVVAFVDMETIFQEYPETQKAKAEYFVELSNRRQSLADLEKELADLREQLTVLRTTLHEMEEGLKTAPAAASGAAATPAAPDTPAAAPGGEAWISDSTAAATSQAAPGSLTQDLGVSPGSVSAVNESLLQREKTLAEKEKALDEARATAVKDLKQLEEKRSMQIMGKLYNALVQLADEQGITLVVDKRSILYGTGTLDLTERLRRRVRGLPDPEVER
jgi:Skp family chaperone for outer membrane proteins